VVSEHINDIQKNLLAGKRDTALRRLNTAFRDVNDYRQKVLNKLDDLTGGELTQQLAGSTLRPLTPRGWPSKVVPTAAAGYGVANVGLGVAPAIMAASPRAMGNLAYYSGYGARAVNQAGSRLGPYFKYLSQVGRVQED